MFAVTKVIKDDRTILGFYEELDAARAEAKRINGLEKERCTICVIEADFDENGRIKGGKYKLYDAFY